MALRVGKSVRGPDGRLTCAHPGCGKSYAKSEHLSRHRHTHGEARFRCVYEDCGRGFFETDALRRHALSHTRPHPGPSPLELALAASEKRVVEEVAARAVAEKRAEEEAAARVAAERLLEEQRASPPSPPQEAPLVECAVCGEVHHVPTGALVRLCDLPTCKRAVHVRCFCPGDLPEDADFFCDVCAGKYGFDGRALVMASVETTGVKLALERVNLEIDLVPADGSCFFVAVARATGVPLRELKRMAVDAAVEVARWAKGKTPKQRVKTEDERHFLSCIAVYGGDDWLDRVQARIRDLAPAPDQRNRGGSVEPWNTEAMDLVVLVMASVVRCPIRIWRYNLSSKQALHFDDYAVRTLPGKNPPRTTETGPLVQLVRTKAGIRLEHFDRVIPL